MDHQFNPWRYALQIGLISSIAVLYMGVIGMIATFHEREVIRDLVTLGQLLIIVPPFTLGYTVASRMKKAGQSPLMGLLGGVLVGVLTAVLTIVFLFLAEPLDMRAILVNVNRDWVEVVTFDNRSDLVTGSLMLTLVTAVAGLLGAVLAVLPARLRDALSFGILVTLLVGMFGATLTLALQQTVSDDILDLIFRRDTLLLSAALVIFALSVGGHLLWSAGGKNVQASMASMPASSRNTVRLVWYGVLIVILFTLPFLIGRSLSEILVTVGIYILMGLGLNIAIGLTGMLDLGYVTNYAIGAYVMAVLTSTSELGRGGGLNFWLVLPIAVILAMITRFLLTLPVLKMRGDYLAIATLGFGEIIGTLANSDWLAPLVGGAQGVLFIPKPNFIGTDLVDPEQLYYVVLFACLLFLFISVRLNNSRIGRQWMAVREDEDVARAMGIDVTRSKLLALTLAAAAGGLAGAIFAAKVGTVFPNSFTLFVSINVLALIIVGGLGSIPGIIVGSLALVGMPELLREFSEYRFLIYGALLIFMMLNRPEGLLPSQVVAREMKGEDEPVPARAGAGD
jgi:branched-chain amino acid transport system permease protein